MNKQAFNLIIIISLICLLQLNSCKKNNDNPANTLPETGIVTDIDGNSYKTVKIGFQWWMAENLKVTHFRNGKVIPEITDNDIWNSQKTSARCNYNNDVTNDSIYGKLYNFYAIVDTQNICPVGWHVPTDGEWNALETTIGRNTSAGGKLKEIGLLHWYTPNTGATNETGFNGRPGGVRNYYGAFDYKTFYGYWWSSSSVNDSMAWYRNLSYGFSYIDGDAQKKRFGYSVRCVKD